MASINSPSLARRPAGTMQVPIEPDSRRFADQMILGHETPVAPVGAVVAIITDHQVIAWGHDHFARIAAVVLAGHRRLDALIGAFEPTIAGRAGRGAEFLGSRGRERMVSVLCEEFGRQAHVVVAAVVKASVALQGHRLAVDDELVGYDPDMVAR